MIAQYMHEEFPYLMYDLIDVLGTAIVNNGRKKKDVIKSLFQRKPKRPAELKREREQGELITVPDGKGGTITVRMVK